MTSARTEKATHELETGMTFLVLRHTKVGAITMAVVANQGTDNCRESQ